MSKNSKKAYSRKEEQQGKRVVIGIAIVFIFLGALAVAASFLV